MKNLKNILLATLILAGAALADSPLIQSVSLEHDQLKGGETTQAVVRLAEPAPSGGFQVELWTDDSAQAPNLVTVPAGSTQARFTVTTSAVDTHQQINVAALSPHSSAHTSLTVSPDNQKVMLK